MNENTRNELRRWPPTFGDIIRFLTFAMVAGLFVVWLVLGASTINKQNTQILQGVQTQLQQNEMQIHDVIVQNTTGDRAIVCILRILPDNRTNHRINRCLLAAEQGQDSLHNGGQSGIA